MDDIYIYGLVPIFILFAGLLISSDYCDEHSDLTVLDVFMDIQGAIILTAIWPLVVGAFGIVSIFQWAEATVLIKKRFSDE